VKAQGGLVAVVLPLLNPLLADAEPGRHVLLAQAQVSAALAEVVADGLGLP
jgi:hypothetical protein